MHHFESSKSIPFIVNTCFWAETPPAAPLFIGLRGSPHSSTGPPHSSAARLNSSAARLDSSAARLHSSAGPSLVNGPAERAVGTPPPPTPSGIPLGRRAVPFVCVCVCVCWVGVGGPHLQSTSSATTKGDTRTHTRKKSPKAFPAVGIRFCKKLTPYRSSFFWAPKGASDADLMGDSGRHESRSGGILGPDCRAKREKWRFWKHEKC